MTVIVIMISVSNNIKNIISNINNRGKTSHLAEEILLKVMFKSI